MPCGGQTSPGVRIPPLRFLLNSFDLRRGVYKVLHLAAARRRSKEVQVAQVPEPTTVSDGLWHDVLPRLDHELALLPEKYRLPIFLCDLEGKTCKKAARQLGPAS
jgi:DNA-directed RNA polymerase specialized sigma24 family protein